MANQEHVDLLKKGVDFWNNWRDGHQNIRPNLRGAELEGAKLEGANLSRANLEKANLTLANLENANLRSANLQAAELEGANLSRANLEKANLTLANLENANLRGANLKAAKLKAAILSGVDFSRADLSRTILSGADFNKANLSQANLSQADLSYTTFEGANLSNVIMTPRNLSWLSPDEIRFTAYFRIDIAIETWNTLLVYSYIEPVLQAIRANADLFKKEMESKPGESHAQSSRPLIRGADITIVPQCKGIVFNPDLISFKLIEQWHRTDFRFLAAKELAGTIGQGEITIWSGPLIIATLPLTFQYLKQNVPVGTRRDNDQEVTTYLSTRIFASYSHADKAIVLACRNAYKALGLDVLIDIDTLRSGERWNEALMKMIDSADIFQLFWSQHSAKSRFVRQEWKYALEHNKSEGFIRPVYWEKPLPPLPKELEQFEFKFMNLPRIEIDI